MGSAWNELTLKKAFSDAGYSSDANGLYQHFVDYGNAENVSPSTYFNVNQYMTAKAAQFYKVSSPTSFQIQAMYDTFAAQGLTAWDHYTKYGWQEDINPSVKFDTAKYMEDKLAQMQIQDPAYTMDELKAAFKDNGLSPIEHYFLYGKDEGLAVNTPTSTTGELYNLTDENDIINGTSGNDYITARPGTLGDGDMINGGGGDDTLYAYLNDSNNASTPLINGVETIIVRGQGVATTETGSNNISASDWKVSLDLGDTTGMTKLVNDNSRSDVAIEDVRTDSNKMTIGFYDTDPGDVDFGVFFNSQNIKEFGGGSTGSLKLQLMDVKNAQLNDQPLAEQPFNKFSFYYTADGGEKEVIPLTFRAEDKAKYKGVDADYDSLLVAFNNALADFVTANPQYAGVFKIETGDKFKGTAGTDTVWTDPNGVLIVITAKGGAVDAPTTDENVGWGVTTGNVPSTGGITWGVDKGVSIECPLYQTNIELDNVGRVQWNDVKPGCLPSNDDFGSQAGDMVVGGMGERDGIQRFDVKVDRGSWLSSLASTNNQLRMVRFENADINGDGYYNRPEQAYKNEKAADEFSDYGQIYIGDSQEGGKGIVAWQDAPKLLSTTGLTDVKLVDGSLFEGQMNIGAQITAESYDKYFREVDGYRSVYDAFAPDGEFKYELGKNDDTLNMVVNGGIAADQDFKLLINSNAGNDFINFAFTDLTNNQRANIINGTVNAGHERVIIDGGAGNDVIKFWGDGSVTVKGGAGHDAIYVGQNAADQNAVFLFNIPAAATAQQLAIFVDEVNGAQPLNNDLLGIGVTEFNVAQTANAEILRVKIEFKGISVTADVADIAAGAGKNTKITAEKVNEVIAKAIAEDTYLQHLIVAKDGAGHSLMIESLVDGEFDLTDLNITFSSVLASDRKAGGATFTDLTTAYTTNEAFATNAVDVLDKANPVHHEDGTIGSLEYYGLNMAEAVVNGAEYAIKIGNEVYYTTATSGTTDGDLVAVLNTAVAADGTAFSAKYNAIDVAKAADWTAVSPTDDQGITIHFNSAGNKADVNVELVRISDPVDGTDAGTFSYNIVDAGTGNDTIVLNVASAAGSATVPQYDVLTISGAIGNDVVINFDAAVDKFHVDSSMGTIGRTIGTVNVGSDDTKWTTANWKAVTDAITGDTGFAANGAKGVGMFQNNNGSYTFFQVQNDNTPDVIRSEVTILGTMTFDNDTAAMTTAGTTEWV